MRLFLLLTLYCYHYAVMPKGSKCISPGCSKDTQGQSLHKFPTDDDLKETWIRLVPIVNYEHVEKDRLCNLHFSEEFINISSTRAVLKSGAVPTIWPNVSKYYVKPYAPRPNVQRNVIVEPLTLTYIQRYAKLPKHVYAAIINNELI